MRFIPMKKIQYVFWVLFVTYYAIHSGWSYAQIALLGGLGMLLYMSIVNQLEDGAGDEASSFTDATAKELMRIRTDLTILKINQLNYEDESEDFLRMFRLYLPYTSSFLCTAYQLPNKQKYGKIIAQLDYGIRIDKHGDVDIDADKLKKINSSKVLLQFKKGMSMPVFISDPEIQFAELSRNAKIISIKDEGSELSHALKLTLEINLQSSNEELYSTPDPTQTKETIIRDIYVWDYFPCRHFKADT
jgi:hypothetical protein